MPSRAKARSVSAISAAEPVTRFDRPLTRTRPQRGRSRPASGPGPRPCARPRPGRDRPPGTLRPRPNGEPATPAGPVAGVGEPDVPRIGVSHRGTEHPRPLRADHQRRAVRSRPARKKLAIPGLVPPPIEVDGALAEKRPDDREGLLEAIDPVVERVPVGTELGFVPAGAEAEDEATAAQLIDRRGLLREKGGVVEVRAGDEWAELDPRRGRRDRGEERPRFPRTAWRPVLPAIEKVLADPHRVEALVLDGTGHVEKLGPAHLALDLGQLDPDFQAGGGHGRHGRDGNGGCADFPRDRRLTPHRAVPHPARRHGHDEALRPTRAATAACGPPRADVARFDAPASSRATPRPTPRASNHVHLLLPGDLSPWTRHRPSRFHPRLHDRRLGRADQPPRHPTNTRRGSLLRFRIRSRRRDGRRDVRRDRGVRPGGGDRRPRQRSAGPRTGRRRVPALAGVADDPVKADRGGNRPERSSRIRRLPTSRSSGSRSPTR